MIRRPPRSTRTDTLFPYTTLFRSSVRDIRATLDGKDADFVVIDSIQTMHSDLIDSAPGTVSQVRASAQELIRYAKDSDAAIVLVGHVTKDGTIAGPRVLEHVVDTVLAFERSETRRVGKEGGRTCSLRWWPYK